MLLLIINIIAIVVIVNNELSLIITNSVIIISNIRIIIVIKMNYYGYSGVRGARCDSRSLDISQTQSLQIEATLLLFSLDVNIKD